jgi:replicative DNA helicase
MMQGKGVSVRAVRREFIQMDWAIIKKEAPMEAGAIKYPQYQEIADITTRLIQRQVEALHNILKRSYQELENQRERGSMLRVN